MIFEKKVIGQFKRSVIVRQNTPEELFLYSAEDFPGLVKEKYEFVGNHGQKLVGAFYYYGEKTPTRVVIFEHGMGGGHRSYMKEIEALASRGFTVLSYDHTGCMESEGDDIVGFSQSLADLDCLINTLTLRDGYAECDISVVGHSWGGFSTLNIAKYHPEISHIVAFAGFISVRALLSQFLTGIMKFYIKSLVRYEESLNGNYALASADTALTDSKVKAMVIHSEDDRTVSYSTHFERLKEVYGDRPNTEFVGITGRGHNPNYSEGAVKSLGECVSELTRLRRAGELKTAEEKKAFREKFDWASITEQDPVIWDRIKDFLKN